MNIDTLEDLAKELKNDKNKNVYKIFEDYAKKNNLSEEELEQKLSKEYDCFKCDSCEKFYCYDEYSFFDEECIYCFDSEADDEEEF
jgi:transposase